MFMLILTAFASLLSVYFLWRFWAAFRAFRWWNLIPVAVVAVLATARYWSAALARAGWGSAAEAGRLILLVWLVLLFWFLCAGVALQTWDALAWLAARLYGPARRL